MAIEGIIGTKKGGFWLRDRENRSSWELDGPLFAGWSVTAAARDTGGRWFVGTASDVYGPAIQVTDDGTNWRQIADGPSFGDAADRTLKQVWTIVPAGDRVFAGVDDAGLFVSDDRGEHWAPVAGLNDHATRGAWQPGLGGLCAHSILVDPANDQRLWCGISAVGLFRSDDGGATWHEKNEGIPAVVEDEHCKSIGRCVHGVVADPADANRIWRREHNGMFRSIDGGDSWERIENGLPSWFGFPIARNQQDGALFVIPLESDEYRVPAEGGLEVYRSTDDGNSWASASHGLPTKHCYAGILRKSLAVDHQDACGVYFGTTTGLVFISVNGGDSWQVMPWSLARILSMSVYTV